MAEVANLFDAYSLQARLQPALLALLSVFLSVAVWMPGLYDWGTGFAGVAAACGALVWLAHLSRGLGRKAQRRLYVEWGGIPTTRWLSHRDDRLNAQTKARYHAFFEIHIVGWIATTPDEEARDPQSADAAYESAVEWLKEQTGVGERFSLVLKENISYGFRRNLFGLKWVGLGISVLCVLGNAYQLFCAAGETATSTKPEGIVVLVLSAGAAAAWAALRESWVRDAAEAYARALLATCDAIGREG